MENGIIILIEKNKSNGDFIGEIESYNIDHNELVNGLYAYRDNEDNLEVYITLTTDRDLEEWEYTAFYDYIDLKALGALGETLEEIDDKFNPCFKLKLSYIKNNMEAKIDNIVNEYFDLMNKTYEEIKALEDEYK